MYTSHPSFNEDQFLSQINQFVNLIPKIEEDAKESQKILKKALKSLNTYVDSVQGQNHQLQTKEVAWIGASLYKLHSALPELRDKSRQLGNPNELKLILKDFDKLFNTTLAALLTDPRFANFRIEEKELPLAKQVFDQMLTSICSDAHEEVVGQERPPGALPRMIARGVLISQRNPSTTQKDIFIERIHKIASALYPMALLSASLDSKASVPPLEMEESELLKDQHQFIREQTSQFGVRAVKVWSAEFFGSCLKTMWDKKREGQS